MPQHIVSGKITHQNLGPGFYGIVTTDGDKLLPVEGIPENFRTDGMEVRATVAPADEMMGAAMWGRPVRVVSIEPVMEA